MAIEVGKGNLRSFGEVKKRGCIRGTIEEGTKGFVKASVVACVNLGQVKNRNLRKYEYYCLRDYPNDCSEFGCPKYEEW